MARAKGYSLFGLQFYGECWAGPDDEKRYNMYGKSDKCFEKLKLPWEVCDDKREEECMGHIHANYVYRLKEGKSVDCCLTFIIIIIIIINVYFSSVESWTVRSLFPSYLICNMNCCLFLIITIIIIIIIIIIVINIIIIIITVAISNKTKKKKNNLFT